MSEIHEPLGIYLHLARASERRMRPLERDKMLVLAAVTAAEQGLDRIAACCRQRILAHNPGHVVSQYATISAALEDERFQNYLRQLKRSYSMEKVEHMLGSLGIELAGERNAYYSDYEYAASLLGTTPDELDAQYGEAGSHVEGVEVRQSTLVPANSQQSQNGSESQFNAGLDGWRTSSKIWLVVLLALACAAVGLFLFVLMRQL
jgi:hypothetical protein